MLEPRDDLRHAIGTGAHARESLFYGVMLPEEGLMVFVYTWVGGDDRAGHLFVVAGADDERLAFSASDGEPMDGADFGDWTVGGLHVAHADPLRRCELAFAGEDVSFTATFTGLHDAFSYLDNADGCPSTIADDRFEQSCRVTGTLVLGDREIAIDTTGHRDHSWGTRDWDAIQDWKWISGQAPGGTAFNLMVLHLRGDTTHHGYVLRDGRVVPVASARVRGTYDEHWWQNGAEVSILDEDGVTTRAELERFALFRFEAGERIVLHEAGCRGSIDGVPAPIHFECGWDKGYVALQERRATATAG
jgi:hypothetical protein